MAGSSISPLMMIDMLKNKFYSLALDKVVSIGPDGGYAVPDDEAMLVGSSHGWLALLNERTLDLFLWNPVSGERINLPAIDSLPIPAGNLKFGRGCVDKVILSSPDAERAVMSYGPERRLAFCCPGAAGSEWTTIGDRFHYDEGLGETARVYEDFAYSSGLDRLFCITQYGCLERWDLRDPSAPTMDGSDEDNGEGEDDFEVDGPKVLKYVVVAEQTNEVFVVARSVTYGELGDKNPDPDFKRSVSEYSISTFAYLTTDFDVYKVVGDGTRMSMPRVEESLSLDGLAMFVGINHSFALPAADFPGRLKPDSIYFTDAKELVPPNNTPNYNYGGNEVGIFDYRNKKFFPCYLPLHVQAFTRITPVPVWFTTNSLVSRI